MMNKVVICKECGQRLFANSITYNGNEYCQTCCNRLFCITCEKCGEQTLKTDAIELPDELGVFRCSDCMEEDYSVCGSCNEFCLDDSSIVVHDGDTICETCYNSLYNTCENCSAVFENADIISPYGTAYCIDCFNSLFVECASCGEILGRDYACYTDSGCYCETCCPDDNAELHDYLYTPDYIFYGKTSENLYFGIELEIENNGDSDYLSDINETSQILYAKSDGSLDNGVEIVSHPNTFDYFNETFNTVWNPILNSKNHGYRSYNTTTCGIHIHISKKAFSTLHLYKFMKFFYNNDKFIQIISQRDNGRMDRWASNSATGDNIIEKAKNKKGNENRYSAINLQPRNTVEIRIFRGTLEAESFRKNIEFLHALYYFTKISGMSKLHMDLFIRYIENNKKQYSNLYRFITKK